MLHLNSTSQKFQHHYLRATQILDRSLNITFIQLSTRHDCFSLARFTLIFFVCVFVLVFVCIFEYLNPISFSQFHTVLSQTLIPVSIHLFCCTFSIFWDIALSFIFWRFDVFLGLRFPFLTIPFLLYLHQILEKSWLGTTNADYF